MILSRALAGSTCSSLSSPWERLNWRPSLRRWPSGKPLVTRCRNFRPQELAESADVFPIELLDMQQSRKVLFGADLLADMTIDMRDYRMQLERDLKTRYLLLGAGIWPSAATSTHQPPDV